MPDTDLTSERDRSVDEGAALDAVSVALEHHEGVTLDDVRAWATKADAKTVRALDASAVEAACVEVRREAAAHLREQGVAEGDAAQALYAALVDARRGGLLAQRVTLGSMLRDGIPPVEWLESPSLGERLFYREALFIISGHKKSGKSWAMAATALDCARAGRPAVYLDLENGQRLFAKRMMLLGARADEIDAHLHYVPFPAGLSLDTLSDQLEDIAHTLPGAFIVVDSLRGLMSRLSPAGNPLNPNDHQAIEVVAAPFMEAVKTRGLTVGIIDHAKKTGSESDEYSTAGAGAKEAAVDAVYFWTKVERYNRDTAGLVKLTATSDRDGELDFERYWKVGGQGEGQPFRFTSADSDEVGTMGKVRAAVLDFLMDNAGQAFTANAVVNAKTVQGKAENIRRALDLLADDAGVHRDDNPKRKDSVVYSYDPDRDREDTSSGLPL